MDTMKTGRILAEVLDERVRQDEKWGEQNLKDGTGPGLGFDRLADAFKAENDKRLALGTAQWWQVLQEEVFEAGAATTEDALREELIQVAAVAVQWVEAIDRRRAARAAASQ